MKRRPSLISRITSFFKRRSKSRVAPAGKAKPAREPKGRTIEPLEGRIAPAAFIDAHTISFTDLDNDLVTVHFSKALFTNDQDPLLDSIFKFTDGTSNIGFHSGGLDQKEQLQLIDLTKTATVSFTTFLKAADGTSVTVTAVKKDSLSGDDLTNIGTISATGIALGAVTIDGDLGSIDAGRGGPGGGVKSLTVNSLYKFGSATQVTGGTASDQLESRILGRMGMLDVNTDVYGYLRVLDGTSGFSDVTIPARIDVVKVGGSLRGNATVATTSNNTGTIESAGSIGSVEILGMHDPQNSADRAGLVGGGGTNSGSLIAAGAIGKVTVADSLTGGGGLKSGSISAANIGTVNVSGALSGGAGNNSGSILASANIGLVKVTGGLTGAAGSSSGSIVATKSIASAEIGGHLTGGAGSKSGSLQAANLVTATVGGLDGAAGSGSGSISISKTLGTLTVTGDVTGGSEVNSGSILAAGSAGPIHVHGNLTGGSAFLSGSIRGAKGLSIVSVDDALMGGGGDRSGSIISDGGITALSVGKLIGGNGAGSGSIFAGLDPLALKGIASATVNEGIVGGAGISSGSIVGGKLVSVRVGSIGQSADIHGGVGAFSGSIVSESTITAAAVFGSVYGGTGAQSGSIQSHGALANVGIQGDLKGGQGAFSGSIRALERAKDDFTGIAGTLGTAVVRGNIVGGTGADSGRIEASGNLGVVAAGSLTSGAGTGSGSIAAGAGYLGAGNAGAITILGDVAAGDGAGDASISVRGKLTSFSAGSLTNATVQVGDNIVTAIVRGNMVNSLITAEGQVTPVPTVGDIAIGALTVKGDVTSSRILAGYGIDGTAMNADASIGAVSVAGNWVGSDLVAGVVDVNGDGFGNADDTAISNGTDRLDYLSRIASVLIHGTITGTAAAGDHFGFTAQKIAAFKVGTSSLAFDLKAGNQSFAIAGTDDVSAREVAV